MRRLLASLAFLAGFLPAIAAAQAPPAVPALPDTARLTSYSISAGTGPYAAGFAIFGDSTDYGNWLEVWLCPTTSSCTKLAPTTDWTLSLTSGTLATAARPLTNAQVTLTAPQTGTLEIVGERRPRRIAQFTENKGVPARDLNVALTDVVAQNRETWDRALRAIVAPPGEVLTALPPATARIGKFLIFDGSGNPVLASPTPGLGNVIGPVSSTIGHPAIWNNATGTLLSDPTSITYLTCGGVNDTAAVNAALLASNARVLVINRGNCPVDPVTISQTNANAPRQIIAYGAVLQARASSASPTLTIENVQGLLTGFEASGLKIDANSLHAYPLKIHGSQFASYRDIEATGGTAGGVWLSGEPGFGIYYNTFQNIYSHNNAVGAGYIAKSINNTGQYYIAANVFSGPRSIANGSFGFDLDYASLGIYSGDAETNATCGFNIDHSIQVDIYSTHIEANNGTACAFTGTANTTNLKVYGGRTVGTITASLLTAVSNTFNTSDAAAAPIISTLRCSQLPALTGDVTSSAGSCTTALGNIPAAVAMAGNIIATNIAAPGTPASGKTGLYVDSTDLRFHDKNASGVIGTTVVSDTGAANNFLTAISAAGVISKAQPAFTNLSGSIAVAQIPASGVPAQIGAVAKVKFQKFTASGTYTPSTGILFAVVECVGSGGGGGGVAGTGSQIYGGGGGGSGGYSRVTLTAATIGVSQTVTIGTAGAGGSAGANNGATGGDVSLGSLCVAKGGSGGLFGSAGQVGLGGAGGASGTGTGDITAAGAPGGGGFFNAVNANQTFQGGSGGSSFFGGGAAGLGVGTGGNASNYGSGGGGALQNAAANSAGGNGSTGIVVIQEFTNQ